MKAMLLLAVLCLAGSTLQGAGTFYVYRAGQQYGCKETVGLRLNNFIRHEALHN